MVCNESRDASLWLSMRAGRKHRRRWKIFVCSSERPFWFLVNAKTPLPPKGWGTIDGSKTMNLDWQAARCSKNGGSQFANRALIEHDGSRWASRALIGKVSAGKSRVDQHRRIPNKWRNNGGSRREFCDCCSLRDLVHSWYPLWCVLAVSAIAMRSAISNAAIAPPFLKRCGSSSNRKSPAIFANLICCRENC